MIHNRITLEFITPSFKNKFKKSLPDISMPFLETLFPIPISMLNNEPLKQYETFIWHDTVWGRDISDRPSRILKIEEFPSSLAITYQTQNEHSTMNFVRHLAAMLPVRRIYLEFYNSNPNFCIDNKTPQQSRHLGCTHKHCRDYVLPKFLDFDWSLLSHPIYEVHKTMQNEVKGKWNGDILSEDEHGRIYHHLIYLLTLFTMFKTPEISKVRAIFEQQLSLMDNPYLTLTMLTDSFRPMPDTSSSNAVNTLTLFNEHRYLQPKNILRYGLPIRRF